MSCRDCELFQDDYRSGRGYGEFYIRAGTGDVLVLACDKHLGIIQEAVRAYGNEAMEYEKGYDEEVEDV